MPRGREPGASQPRRPRAPPAPRSCREPHGARRPRRAAQALGRGPDGRQLVSGDRFPAPALPWQVPAPRPPTGPRPPRALQRRARGRAPGWAAHVTRRALPRSAQSRSGCAGERSARLGPARPGPAPPRSARLGSARPRSSPAPPLLTPRLASPAALPGAPRPCCGWTSHSSITEASGPGRWRIALKNHGPSQCVSHTVELPWVGSAPPHPKTSEFFEMIEKMQGSRMDEQRCSFPPPLKVGPRGCCMGAGALDLPPPAHLGLPTYAGMSSAVLDGACALHHAARCWAAAGSDAPRTLGEPALQRPEVLRDFSHSSSSASSFGSVVEENVGADDYMGMECQASGTPHKQDSFIYSTWLDDSLSTASGGSSPGPSQSPQPEPRKPGDPACPEIKIQLEKSEQHTPHLPGEDGNSHGLCPAPSPHSPSPAAPTQEAQAEGLAEGPELCHSRR
ncbi:rap1 GTPase-activating protein 1 [Dermochelys coriacea]|uniref:rap1 GTPase-activating protein 1 n=1 Tax=Dermochelys coriacea TaxID=27794 RepID=UPI001CA96DCA|nr:rap1 GTPase-activating protein 1 [Dermochelys coriacea]